MISFVPAVAMATFITAYTIVPPRQATNAGPAPPHFRNCDHARSAGAAPIRRGEPGYRDALDRDQDGIACEPYRGR